MMRRHLDAIGSIRSNVPCCIPNVSERPVEIATFLQGAFGVRLDAAEHLDEGLGKLTVVHHNATCAIEGPAPVNTLLAFHVRVALTCGCAIIVVDRHAGRAADRSALGHRLSLCNSLPNAGIRHGREPDLPRIGEQVPMR
jgi:hypothetical protein